uniref:C2H2-type domain-containing protein n=1 Tax=viral metagenome TaxID=1070528 RepID=A0A6C0CAS4_9ZZZZ
MTSYVCSNCGYNAGNKSHLDRHMNKKKPCSPQSVHGNTKKIIDLELSDTEESDTESYPCEICNVSYRRKYHLKRHIEETEMHANNLQKIENSSNNTIHGNGNNVDIDNSINKTIISPTINIMLNTPHDYTYNNIDDLTLFEQYKSISSLDSPYSELLANLNFNPKKKEYHNIHYGDMHHGTAQVYVSTKKVEETIDTVLKNIICTKQNMIQLIFYRFRFFLSLKGVKKIPYAIYYGHDPNKVNNRQHRVMYNQLMRHTKMYLFNNRNTNKNANQNDNDENIPDDGDPFWWALSKNLVWSEVSAYITKMDKWNIDFTQDLYDIKIQLLSCINNKKSKLTFFAKLLKRLNYFINNFENDRCESSSDIDDK